jgi:hypothetical protein
VYCLARIQNDRGGWQLYMTLNRSLAGDYCEAQHVGGILRPSATRAATEARLTYREYRKQLALASGGSDLCHGRRGGRRTHLDMTGALLSRGQSNGVMPFSRLCRSDA